MAHAANLKHSAANVYDRPPPYGPIKELARDRNVTTEAASKATVRGHLSNPRVRHSRVVRVAIETRCRTGPLHPWDRHCTAARASRASSPFRKGLYGTPQGPRDGGLRGSSAAEARAVRASRSPACWLPPGTETPSRVRGGYRPGTRRRGGDPATEPPRGVDRRARHPRGTGQSLPIRATCRLPAASGQADHRLPRARAAKRKTPMVAGTSLPSAGGGTSR
jgi:hypothetical protein